MSEISSNLTTEQSDTSSAPINLQNIHFECTQCGKCCESYFPLTFDEMFKYKDTFVQELRISYHLFPAYLSATEYADIKNLYQKMYVSYATKQSQYQAFFLNPQVIQSSYEKMCPQLDNNLCSIQSDKPLNCKALPLEATLPDSLQSKQFVHWILAGGMKKYECNLTNVNSLPEQSRAGKVQDPLFIEWNKETQQYEFMQSEYKNAYLQEKQDLCDSLNLKRDVMHHYMSYAQKDIDTLYDTFRKDQTYTILTHTGSVISAMIAKNVCSKEKAINYFESQIKLITQEMNKAKERKNKEEREKTQFYKEMAFIYNAFIAHLTVE